MHLCRTVAIVWPCIGFEDAYFWQFSTEQSGFTKHWMQSNCNPSCFGWSSAENVHEVVQLCCSLSKSISLPRSSTPQPLCLPQTIARSLWLLGRNLKGFAVWPQGYLLPQRSTLLFCLLVLLLHHHATNKKIKYWSAKMTNHLLPH